jgi:hypothetical protein
MLGWLHEEGQSGGFGVCTDLLDFFEVLDGGRGDEKGKRFLLCGKDRATETARTEVDPPPSAKDDN